MFAYCYMTGQIEFGHFLPDHGALPIAKGDDAPLRQFISGVAERSRTQKDMLLVPGIRFDEHNDPDQAYGALMTWLGWIGPAAPEDLMVFGARNTKSNPRKRGKALD